MGAGVKYAGDVSLRSRPGPSGAGACFCRGRGGSGRYVAGAISFSAGRDRNRKGRKDPRFRTFRASTLAETLVMMLVAGIVFLTVMDGLTLFSRLQAQRMEALTAAGRRIRRVLPCRMADLPCRQHSARCTRTAGVVLRGQPVGIVAPRLGAGLFLRGFPRHAAAGCRNAAAGNLRKRSLHINRGRMRQFGRHDIRRRVRFCTRCCVRHRSR